MSDNPLVVNALKLCLNNHLSPTGLLLSRILSEFDIGNLSTYKLCQNDIYSSIISKYSTMSMLSHEEMSFCDVVKELIDCMHSSFSCGLSNEQCKSIIEHITTI